MKAWVDYLGTISDDDHIIVDSPRRGVTTGRPRSAHRTSSSRPGPTTSPPTCSPRWRPSWAIRPT
ncbi:hypothetical protein NKH18_38865 [Streptomyces sp. M10(2022)]